MSATSILSRPVVVASIGAAGLDLDFSASEEERAALAAAYDLAAVTHLSARTTLRTDDKRAVLAAGRVAADIAQTCVVTLVQVAQHIDEPFSVRFLAPDSPDIPEPPKPGAEVVIDLDQPEPPEILTGPAIDVGALVEEHFVLAIDPYPRAPDAKLPAEAAGSPQTDGDSPFATLAGFAAKRPQKG